MPDFSIEIRRVSNGWIIDRKGMSSGCFVFATRTELDDWLRHEIDKIPSPKERANALLDGVPKHRTVVAEGA